MATEGWRHAIQETVISAAVILASDVVLQHLDGRLDLATDKAAVKKALHWAASRPGRIVTSAVNKGSLGIPLRTRQSLTLESEVRLLLKAHGLDSAGKMPELLGVHEVHKAGHTFDVMLGNAEKLTLRMSLPQSSEENPTSSAILTYLQDVMNGVILPVCDRMMSIYAVLIEWGELGYNILSQRVLNAGLVEQILIGSVMAINVVVAGSYFVRVIRPLDPASNKPEAIMPATDDEDHEARLGADEDQESEFDDKQDWQKATGDESSAEKVEEEVIDEVLEQEPDFMELKYMEALQCLVETSSALEILKSETEQQKELLATKDRRYDEDMQVQGLLDAKEGTIRILRSEASTAERLLDRRDQELMRLDMVNTTLESTADQQKKAITKLTTRAEERTKTIKNLTTMLADEQTEKQLMRTDFTKLRSDNNLQSTTIRALHSSQKEQEQKISELRKENSALEIDAKKSLKLVEELETTNEELGAEVISLIETNQDLQDQVDDDTVAFDNKLDDIDQLTTDKETLRAEIERLLGINEQSNKVEHTSAASAADSRKTIDALRSDNQKIEGQAKVLESKNNNLQKALSEAKENAKTLQDMNIALKEEVAEGKEECRGLLEKCDEDDAELEAKDNKMQELKKALRDNGKLSIDKDRKISELKKACKYMKSVNDESDAPYHCLEEEAEDLTEAQNSAHTKLKSIQFELDQANIDLNRVRADLEESREENEALKAALEGRELEAKSDGDEEGEEDEEEKDEADKLEGDRDEAHEEDEEDESDGEYEDARDEAREEDEGEDESDEDAHDDHGPDSGGHEAGQGEGNNHHGEGHEDGGADDGEGDDQGGDAPDGGAVKIDQGGDDNEASVQSATPTTQETPQQPPKADGLSDTVHSPSVYPPHAGPANNALPPAVADPPFPFSQEPQNPHLGPVQFASEASAKADRVILPIRRRKNVSGRDGFQENPFAGMALPGISPKQEPDVDTSTATTPTQTSSAQDITSEQPKQAPSIEAADSSVPSDAAFSEPGIPIVEPKAPTQTSATQDSTPALTSTTAHPSHDPSAAQAQVPPQTAEEEAKEQRLRSDELIETERSSPTPSATEEQSAGTKATQHGGPTDELIDSVQPSPTPSAAGE